jgi:hypothetical protein
MALRALKRLVMLMSEGGSVSDASTVETNYPENGDDDDDDDYSHHDDEFWADRDRVLFSPRRSVDYAVEARTEMLDYSATFAEAARTLNAEHMHGGVTFAVDGRTLVASRDGVVLARWCVWTDEAGHVMLTCDRDRTNEGFDNPVDAEKVVSAVKRFLNLFDTSYGFDAWVRGMMEWLGEGFEKVGVFEMDWNAEVRRVGGRVVTVSPCWSCGGYKVKWLGMYTRCADDNDFREELLATGDDEGWDDEYVDPYFGRATVTNYDSTHPDDEPRERLDYTWVFTEAAAQLNARGLYDGVTFAVDGLWLVARRDEERIARWAVWTDDVYRILLMCDMDPSHERMSGAVSVERVVTSVKQFLDIWYVPCGFDAWLDGVMADLGEGFEVVSKDEGELKASIKCVGCEPLTVSPCWSFDGVKVKSRTEYRRYHWDGQFREELRGRRQGARGLLEGMSLEDGPAARSGGGPI